MSEPVFTIECAGGCGRTLETSSLTVLWTVSMCPECEKKKS
jgi:hypothetical protein